MESQLNDIDRYHSSPGRTFINQEGRGLQYYNVMDSHQSLIRPPEVCAAMLERLTLYAKSSAEHYG